MNDKYLVKVYQKPGTGYILLTALLIYMELKNAKKIMALRNKLESSERGTEEKGD